MRTSIIIITYNSQACITDCLKSVFDNASDLELKTIIIDNNSRDKTIETVESFSGLDISLIKNHNNIGFAKAVNQGLQIAKNDFKSDYYLILNPDAVLENNCLQILIEKMNEDEQLGITSPLIIHPADKRVWFGGGKINWLRLRAQHFKPKKLGDKIFSEYITGCCMLIKKPVIEKIGYFDKRFFLYYEDVDFSLRARKSGFELAVIPSAVCYHKESQSSDPETKNYYLVKSGLLFFRKHYPLIFKPYFWFLYGLRILYHKLISKKKTVLNALIETN